MKPSAVGAVSVQLNGTRTILSGTDCGIATYRFGSSTIYNGRAVDLLVEVLPGEDNDLGSNCITFVGNSITVDIRDTDAADNFAFMDLKIMVVQKGTTTPIEVDRLAVSGFDLDSTGTTATGTDDIYFQNPDGTFISADSGVTASTGSFFGGQYQTKLKGQATGNCDDSPATGGLIDVRCRGAAMFVNGANGPNTVSSVTLRVQNDNAYGTSSSGTRRFQLSFDFSYIDQLILNTQDYGDAANSYGTAGATISTARSLGYGILPDSEATNQLSASANGDDVDGSTIAGKFDDEDAVKANNLPLDNQTFFTNTTTNLNVTTFGLGYLSAWLDLNKDGDFLDAGEKVLSDLQITNPSVLTSTVPLNIPSTATAGNTTMRFRFSADTGASDTGLTSTGEVEDYQIAIARYDYGDAPSSFGDAIHDIPLTPTVYLGSVQPDKELNTQLGADAGAAARGDDATGIPDDEDAFTTLANVSTVGNYNLTVPVTNSGASATLHAWIDFNQNGKFEAGEYQSAAVANGATNANLSWVIPSGTTAGNTYARFRLTSTSLTDNTSTANQDERSIGAANDGEVEDYQVAIAQAKDYGDAPDTYGTDNTANNSSNTSEPIGANHGIVSGLFLGATRPDYETNGFVDGTDNNGNATDDDDPVGTGTGNGDDEDNFTLPTLTAGATSYTIPASNITATNTIGQAATLHAWVDFNKNGKFDSTEYASVAVNSSTTGGNPTANLAWSGITVGAAGNTYARFRLTSDSAINNTTPGGAANNGEVEDYQIAIAQPRDYGDAPDSYGTNSTNNSGEGIGANHIITSTLKLGTNSPDFELDAQTPLDGTGDDTRGIDDEDAFVTLADIPTVGNYNLTVPLSNTGGSATLHAWIDFNQNSKFEVGEYQSAAVANAATSANLSWAVLNGTIPGNTYVRFRLTTTTLTDDTTTTNQDERSIGAANDGEVEDYQVAISPSTVSDPNLLLVKRITAINLGKPDEILFNNFVDDSGTTNDTDPLWPNRSVYLRGALDAGKVKPGDEVEYTVYFLSNGNSNAKEVKICDVVPDQMTFVKNTYGVELGIGLGLDPAVLPTSPNLKLSNLLNDDQGDFYGAGTTPPANLCKKVNSANTLVNVNGTNNDNGAVVVKIPDLPKANTSGSPKDSYGFIRFRAKVK